jgi:hypothetical protein
MTPVVPSLLDADDIENMASCVAACWTVFTELLPGSTFIKSVTVFCQCVLSLFFQESAKKDARQTFEEEQRMDSREEGTSSEARQTNQK